MAKEIPDRVVVRVALPAHAAEKLLHLTPEMREELGRMLGGKLIAATRCHTKPTETADDCP